MNPLLDHVAIRVADRDAVAAELLDLLEVEVIERTERFTLIGAHPDHGKITLLDAEPGVIPSSERIVAVVLADVADAAAPPIQLSCGLTLTFAHAAHMLDPIEAESVPRHALIGVSLRAADPITLASELSTTHGWHIQSAATDVAVLDVTPRGNGRLTISREAWDPARPALLDHIGVRVDDLASWEQDAADRGIIVDRRVEAPHSDAVFIAGPEQLIIEYVELTAAFQRT